MIPDFDLDKKNEIHYRLKYIPAKFANFVYICISMHWKNNIFDLKVVIFTTRSTNIYKICELCRAIFSSFYNICLATNLCSFTHSN
jgi:hypothetical protein